MSDKDESGDTVAWRDGDVKASVAIQKTWMGAVHFDTLLVNYKHGNFSAILGAVEDLAKTRTKTDYERLFFPPDNLINTCYTGVEPGQGWAFMNG